MPPKPRTRRNTSETSTGSSSSPPPPPPGSPPGAPPVPPPNPQPEEKPENVDMEFGMGGDEDEINGEDQNLNQGGPAIQVNPINQGGPHLNGVNPNPQNNRANRPPYVARHFGFIPQGGDVPNLKPTLINLLGQNQFGGALNEDPHAHLAVFEEHCGTFANEGNDLDTLKLKCFHLSLRDNARSWLRTVNRNNLQTWADMEKFFLGKYFPPSKTQHFRANITTFKQAEG